MEKPITIPISFSLVEFQPGSRQYNKAILVPVDKPIIITLDIPLQCEYIKNAEEIIIKQLGTDRVPEPQLTINGWKFIEDAFLARTEKSNEEKQSENDIKWEDN